MLMKRKVVHIVPTFDLGGVQTGILYSLNDLREKYDYKVLVISVIDHDWIKAQPDEIKNQIIWSGSNNIVKGWLNAYRILRREKPSIIISSLWKSVLLSVTYRVLNRKTKLIGFYHTSRFVHQLNNLFLNIMGRFQDGAFADSEAVKKFIAQKYSVKDAEIIPFNFSFKAKKKEQKTFNTEAIKLAYFGRLNEQKGVFRAIQFCKLLKLANIQFQFDLYGEGEIEKVDLFIKKHNLENVVVIHQLLSIDEVMNRMNNYDFLLQLSNHEGMALAVVEAMNAGLVPIVTPVGEISNYSKDGYNAIWLNHDFDHNLNELLLKVKKVIDNPNLYYEMSNRTRDLFKNYKTYTEALIEAIDKIQI